MLHAAANLLLIGICKGSKIDVFANNRFWMAKVHDIDQGIMRISFEAGDDGLQKRVRIKDFLKTWRLPLDDVLTARTTLVLRDAIERE